jgi:hypothetical protein
VGSNLVRYVLDTFCLPIMMIFGLKEVCFDLCLK